MLGAAHVARWCRQTGKGSTHRPSPWLSPQPSPWLTGQHDDPNQVALTSSHPLTMIAVPRTPAPDPTLASV